MTRLRRPASPLLKTLLLALVLASHSGCFLIGYDGLQVAPEDSGAMDGASGPHLDGSARTDASAHMFDADGDAGDVSLDASDGSMGLDAAHDAEAMVDSGPVPDASQDAQTDDGGQRDSGQDDGGQDDGGQGDGGQDDGGQGDGGQDDGGQDDGGQDDGGQGDGDGDGDQGDGDQGDGDQGDGDQGDGDQGDGDQGDGDQGNWWDDIPTSQPCGALPTCSQTCAAGQQECHFACNKLQCQSTCAEGSRCHSECKAGLGSTCGLSCKDGAFCSLGCGKTTQCGLSCGQGASCELDCDRSTSCNLSCASGASCLLHCGSGLVCNVTCNGTPTSCPDGSVACNRPCP